MEANRKTKHNDLLILFTRFPVPGQVKTRLIPALGPYKAAKLQKILTGESISQGARLADRRGATVEIYFCGGDRAEMKEMFKTELPLREQTGESLGDRLSAAFRAGFARGKTRVVIAGTDCPLLTAEVMESALKRLRDCDAVVGPATDGGFYLIGLRSLEASIFKGIDWGTEAAFRQLIENLKRNSLKVGIMEYLTDIDEPEDLTALPRWIDGSLN